MPRVCVAEGFNIEILNQILEQVKFVLSHLIFLAMSISTTFINQKFSVLEHSKLQIAAFNHKICKKMQFLLPKDCKFVGLVVETLEILVARNKIIWEPCLPP